MFEIKMSENKINEVKRQYKNLVTKERVIELYELHMDDIVKNNKNYDRQIKNNIVSGLLVLGMKPEIIGYCMYELELTDLLQNNSIEEINDMFEIEE